MYIFINISSDFLFRPGVHIKSQLDLIKKIRASRKVSRKVLYFGRNAAHVLKSARTLLVQPSRIPRWISKNLLAVCSYEFLVMVNLERAYSFRVQSGKITVCFSSKSRNVIVCIDS